MLRTPPDERSDELGDERGSDERGVRVEHDSDGDATKLRRQAPFLDDASMNPPSVISTASPAAEARSARSSPSSSGAQHLLLQPDFGQVAVVPGRLQPG